MADFYLEPNPDWHDQWRQDLTTRREANAAFRVAMRALYPLGFNWAAGHIQISDTARAWSKSDSARLIGRWCRNFFELGVLYQSSAGDEFAAMLKAWLAKKTVPLRPAGLTPDPVRDGWPVALPWAGSVFCFTGSLNWASREVAEGIVVSRGGRCVERPVKELDFLVHGEKAGGKYTAALKLRSQGQPVLFLPGEQLPSLF
jgi:hypothetical protein